jgi:hypothetical protein
VRGFVSTWDLPFIYIKICFKTGNKNLKNRAVFLKGHTRVFNSFALFRHNIACAFGVNKGLAGFCKFDFKRVFANPKP